MRCLSDVFGVILWDRMQNKTILEKLVSRQWKTSCDRKLQNPLSDSSAAYAGKVVVLIYNSDVS